MRINRVVTSPELKIGGMPPEVAPPPIDQELVLCCMACGKEMPELTTPEGREHLRELTDGKFTPETFPKDCLICKKCDRELTRKYELAKLSWRPGWGGWLVRAMMQLKAWGDERKLKV